MSVKNASQPLSGFPWLKSNWFLSFLLPLLLVWLLTLPAVSPLLQPTLTHSADGLLHMYRIVALDHLLRQGVFFSRWLPDLAYGYGLPLFVYYAPLSYYLTEALHLLGLNLIFALNASAGLALLLAATGLYLLVKDGFGPQAGVLASVAYVYAPYSLFNLFSRGSFPVTWAGAIFPFVFWSFGRLLRSHHPAGLPLAALTLGAALLMHNISNLLFLPLLLLYLAIELCFKPQALSRVGLALVLGLALSAFFWLPAVLERDFAQVQRVITPPDFDYQTNFVSPGQLFALPQPANTGLLNPADPLTLGPAQVALAVITLVSGVVGLFLRDPGRVRFSAEFLPERRRNLAAPLLFATITLAGAIFMMLPVSVGIWDRLPLVAFVQQPHRLLSVTALALAILAGAAPACLPRRFGFGLTVIGIITIFVTAVPLLYPRYYATLPQPPSLTGMLAYEHASGAIGTTSFGEYLPRWVQQIPRESPLEPLYQAGAPIERLDRAYLPAGARVESAVYGVNQLELTLDTPQPFQAVFHTFYFPGWQATLNDQPATLAPVTERGLIGVTVPAGQHQLRLFFTETPLRLAANLASVLALLTIAGLAAFAPAIVSKEKNQRDMHPSPSPDKITRPSLASGQWVGLTALGLALLLTKTVYLDRFDNPLKQVFEGEKVAGVEVVQPTNFGHQVNLLGYELAQADVVSGHTFDLTLYWQARQPLSVNYSALAQLVDEAQHLYGGQDNLHPGNLPTRRWESWGFVQDAHQVRIPPGTPPGDYFLVAGLYDPATWARLPVVEGGAQGWADVVSLPVTVSRPPVEPTLAELNIAWPGAADCQAPVEALEGESSLCFLGATPEREFIQPGDFLRVALFWEAIEAPARNYQVSLQWLTAQGAVALAETSRPSFGRYPTLVWRAGERVRDNHALWVPADFPAGAYHLQVTLLDEAGQVAGRWPDVGQLTSQLP